MDSQQTPSTDRTKLHKSSDEVKTERWERKRKRWARWEFWTVIVGLPAGLIGIGFPLYDGFIRHHQDEIAQEQHQADLKNQIASLHPKDSLHLALAYAARPTDTIGEGTALLPPGQPILAQATSEANTPYLLEIDGNGTATLDTDAHFREKYGSKFKPNGQSWTIVALAADPASLTADRIAQIQKEFSTNITPLNLPVGRQITWSDTGWTWGKPSDTNSRSPDTDSSLEVELSTHANAIESLLKTEFPNTPFLGRTFSVNAAAATSQTAGQ